MENFSIGLIYYFFGILSGLIIAGVWHFIIFLLEIKKSKLEMEKILDKDLQTNLDEKAYEKVDECKKRLRWQRKPNPEWVAPLYDEVPTLIKDIAEVYYPDSSDPVKAPGLSYFVRAIEFASKDIADFLQKHKIGKMVDISADKVLKTFAIGKKISKNEKMKKVNKFYKKIHPVWQVVRYKSPFMWFGIAASNIAVRIIQPAIIDIVAHRSIELYSGRFAKEKEKSY